MAAAEERGILRLRLPPVEGGHHRRYRKPPGYRQDYIPSVSQAGWLGFSLISFPVLMSALCLICIAIAFSLIPLSPFKPFLKEFGDGSDSVPDKYGYP